MEKILTRYPDIHSIWDFGRIIGNPFREQNARIRFWDYDWTLNDVKR